jgi:putative nucleotidyltransferase with HDIG domain
MNISFTEYENELLNAVAEAGEKLNIEAFVIGGFVRDKILGRACKDLDFTCIGDGIELARKTSELLKNKNEIIVYRNFGTAMIKSKGFILEFVGARKESYNFNSRKPVVSVGTIEDDISRRDFTINTLSVNLKNINSATVFDPYNGLEDMQNKIIRTPLDPDITFSDDPLRMMRAIRFATQLGFNIETNTFEAIKTKSERLKIVSNERITDELNKIILSQSPGYGLKLMHECGLLSIILPELEELKGVETIGGLSHKDNMYHTIQVLDNISAMTYNLWLRWSAIMHDIGKSRTKKFYENEGWTFHGHEIVGANMVFPIFKRLRLPLDHKLKYVQKLVRLHLRPMALVNDIVTDSAVRRLLFDAGDEIDDLMLLAKADITSKNNEKIATFKENYKLVIQKLKEVEEKDKFRNWQPPIDGEFIMKTFGLEPGRSVGIIKTEIREAILDGIIENNFESAYNFMIIEGEKMGLEVKSEKLIVKKLIVKN